MLRRTNDLNALALMDLSMNRPLENMEDIKVGHQQQKDSPRIGVGRTIETEGQVKVSIEVKMHRTMSANRPCDVPKKHCSQYRRRSKCAELMLTYRR